MGWSSCGHDSGGRPIGYGQDATCDHPGCQAEIHRGLAYACGGMHGEDEVSCEGYFCAEHLHDIVRAPDGRLVTVCASCAAAFDGRG